HEAERELRRAQTELAHVTRVTTLGELTASIVHEVNQPLAAISTNGEACLRFLNRDVPNLAEVREAVASMMADSRRPSDVGRRIRTVVQKAEPEKASLDINDVINDVILLVQREVATHGIAMRVELSPKSMAVLADRVELQQVIINLVMNAIEAMAAVNDRPRE